MRNHCLMVNEKNAFEVWHKRLGHISAKRLLNISNNDLVIGMPKLNRNSILPVCEPCCKAKLTRNVMPVMNPTCENMLDLVHTDVWGPSQVPSIGGSWYFVTFIDDFSRMTWIFFLRNKSCIFEKFVEFKNMVENQFNRKIKVLRSDGGGEYLSNEFNNFLRSTGIIRQITHRYTPQMNGVAERKNRHILETAKAMLFEANLSKRF